MADAARRQLHAARMRRLRQNHRDGVLVVPVRASNKIIATLMDLGWLAEHESEDRTEIASAIGDLLTDLSDSQQKK